MPPSRRIETAFESYELVAVIGEGGAGRVWRATDTSGAEVAIKMMNPDRATTERRKRFKNEILFCQRTRHENIVRVLDYGSADADGTTVPFYVMPVFAGSLRDANRVDDAEVMLRRFDQILTGVQAAHLQHVFHRDLKPENILFDRDTDALLVADFGVAEFLDEELYTLVETKPGTRLANFTYAAPVQQVRGRPTDARTDIFSLGLILNEIYTGEVPRGSGYRTIGAVAPEYAWLDPLVDAMTQQDPNKRPSTVEDIKHSMRLHRQAFVAEQRLSEIRNVVIPVGEEDDPLAIEPPRLIDFDWERDTLTLILDQEVNMGWVSALKNKMGNYSYAHGKPPTAFECQGKHARVRAHEREVQNIINNFKSWLPLATNAYRDDRERLRQQQRELRQQSLLAEREEIERRQRLRRDVKI